MRLPLDKVQDSGYLQPGTYNARIFDIKYETIKDKEVMKVTFKDMVSGGTVQDTFWLTEAALWRVKKLAGATGVHDKEQLKNFDTENLLGNSVQIWVIKDDKGYSRVDDFGELPGAGPDDGEKEKLFADLKGKSKAKADTKAESAHTPEDDLGDDPF